MFECVIIAGLAWLHVDDPERYFRRDAIVLVGWSSRRRGTRVILTKGTGAAIWAEDMSSRDVLEIVANCTDP